MMKTRAIAITGGIGSGKTAVMKILKSFGAQTILTDEVNASLLEDKEYIETIGKNFAGTVEKGAVNRRALSDIVFRDKEKLKLLNSLAHPRIKIIIENTIKTSILPLIFVEVPLLIESGMQSVFDEIWLVKADKKLRERRAYERGGLTYEKIALIMAAQTDDAEREKFADAVIDNNGGEDALYVSVHNLYSNTVCGI